MNIEAKQSEALEYKDQQIRDLCASLQLFYEQTWDIATVSQLRDAYHLLKAHGCDVEYFEAGVVA